MGLIEDYIDYYRRKSRKTKRDRRGILENFRRWLDHGLKEGKRRDIQDWMDHLSENGLKPTSINQYLTVVKHFYSWLSHELPEPSSPEEIKRTLKRRKEFERMQDVEPFEGSTEGETAHSIDDLRRLIEAAEEEPHRRIFVLGSYLGLRRDEIRLLKTDDVDLDARVIRVRRETTKTPAGVRKLPFPPKLDEYLEGDGEFVIDHNGRPYSQSFFYHFMRKYDGVLDCHLRTKQLRVSFNTHMRSELYERLGKVDGDFILKKLMGHKTKGSDMSEHYMGQSEKVERDKRRAMTEWHYLSEEVPA